MMKDQVLIIVKLMKMVNVLYVNVHYVVRKERKEEIEREIEIERRKLQDDTEKSQKERDKIARALIRKTRRTSSNVKFKNNRISQIFNRSKNYFS